MATLERLLRAKLREASKTDGDVTKVHELGSPGSSLMHMAREQYKQTGFGPLGASSGLEAGFHGLPYGELITHELGRPLAVQTVKCVPSNKRRDTCLKLYFEIIFQTIGLQNL